jgi:methionine-rich copper-binding protein CopC
MAKKQVIVKETVAAAAPARAAKPRAPRVKAAQHSKVVSSESASHAVITESTPAESAVSEGEIIAQIAYGFWEARGRQAGSPLEDWVRAEHEYRQRTVTSL